ncbi:hypothetical protein AB0J80_06600 [Actinoplanes sp. NPDC049548]|uniref:hypothetical protein n=1 Tax=Actinoplanes sp. NPDC049548 TaxID=3155152 RepID=UPI003441B2B6
MHGERGRQQAAVTLLTVFAVVDVLHTLLTIGHYEHRITVVTHGEPDLYPAAFAYELFAHVVGPWQGAGVLSLIVAAAAVLMAVSCARGTPPADRATLGWLSATALLKSLSAVYDVVAAPPDPAVDGVLATRPIAYPLWVASTTVLVIATRRLARAIR